MDGVDIKKAVIFNLAFMGMSVISLLYRYTTISPILLCIWWLIGIAVLIYVCARMMGKSDL